MRRTLILCAAVTLALGGCGDDDSSEARETSGRPATQASAETEAKPAAKRRRGTGIKIGNSEFGRMLFGANNQAIYIFENDPRRKSVCYGECARAWPPVLTTGKPRAGRGVRKRLLGTIKRRNGKRQVTYRGKPLYFYAHEGPREVRCHNVNLNGGLWWVVGPNGRRRP